MQKCCLCILGKSFCQRRVV